MSRRFDPSILLYLVGIAALAYAVWLMAASVPPAPDAVAGLQIAGAMGQAR